MRRNILLHGFLALHSCFSVTAVAAAFSSDDVRIADDVGETKVPQFVRTAADTTTSNKTATQHCVDYTDCETCNDARWCHWCGSTKGCHVQGSMSGCAYGESCHRSDPPSPPSNNNDTCFAHDNCADCSLYSRTCHWCAHDNACHVIGSFYGCVQGVDCYDITHCKRDVPEPIQAPTNGGPFAPFLQFRLIPSIIAGVLAAMTVCCATLCCCAARLTKDAYEDLVLDVTATTPLLYHDADHHHYHHHHHRHAIEPTGRSEPSVTTAVVPVDTETEQQHQQQQLQEQVSAENDPEDTANDQENVPEEDEELSAIPLLQRLPHHHPVTQRRTRRPTRTIHRLYNACVGCYVVTIIAVAASSFCLIKYFPQAPEYSICNDAVAWKSIVDAMAHMSVAADFQLLASIQNTNYLSVEVVSGEGTFYHKNDYVGSFEIPPSTMIQERSITDLLITATFAPEKWKALSIGAEYYAGTLMLSLNSQVTIRVAMLWFNYTYTATVKDVVVNVNQAADRHLCACPTWSDARTQVPRWMTMEDAVSWSSSSSSIDAPQFPSMPEADQTQTPE